MGLFDSVRDLVGGDGDQSAVDRDVGPADGRREPSPTAFRNNAVDAVQQWTEYDLDFSLSSLERLDDLAAKRGPALDVVEADEGEEVAADRHVAYTVQAGSYLGEVLVRRCDGRWTRDGDDWRVRIGDDVAVDVFEVASHSFAEAPAFGEVADRFRDDTDRTTEAGSSSERAAETPSPDAAGMAEYAEELASVYGEYDLDFTPESLSRLDSLADAEWDPDRFADAEVGGDDMESGMYTQLVRQVGSYYGEVLVREHGGEWIRQDDTFAVRVSGDEGRSTVARVFAVARDSLTGPAQFASDYNAVTDEAAVYAPGVADHAAAMPGADEETPVDTEGPDVDRVGEEEADSTAGGSERESTGGDEPAASAASGPEESATGRANGPTEAASPASDSPESEPGDGAPETAEPASAGRDDSADGEEFDVAAAAKRVVDGDLDGSPDGADGEPSDGPAVHSSGADSRGAAGGGASDGGGRREDDGDESGDREEMSLELSEEGGTETEGATAAEMGDEAAAFVATWPGYDLDYSPSSVERLDRLIAEEYPDVADRDGQFRRARAVEIGGYLGEVLRRSLDGEWVQTDGGPSLVVVGPGGEHQFAPVAAAAERFRGERSLREVYDAVSRRVGSSGSGPGHRG